MSFVEHGTGMFFSYSESRLPWVIQVPNGSQVQVGDLILARLVVPGYRLGPGATDFDPARFTLPAGWVVLDWFTRVVGSNPYLLREVIVWVAFRALQAGPGYPWQFAPIEYATPEEFNTRVWGGWTDSNSASSWAQPHYWIFRGERSVTQLDRSWEIGAHVWQPPAPTPSSGTGTSIAFMDDTDWERRSMLPYRSTIIWRPDDVVPTSIATPTVPTSEAAIPSTPGARYAFEMVITYDRDGLEQWVWRPAAFFSAMDTATLVTTVNKPLRPRMTAPASPFPINGRVPIDSAPTVSWVYRPGLVGAQQGWVLRRVVGATTTYWRASDSTWQASQVINPGGHSSVTVSSVALPSEGAFSVAVQSSGVLSEFSSPILFTAYAAPTAAVQVRQTPAGPAVTTLTSTLTPYLVLTGTPGAGTFLDTLEWRVIDDATDDVVDSRTLGSDAISSTWQPSALLNGKTYRVGTRVRNYRGAWSPWTEVELMTGLPEPNALVATATAIVPGTSAPHIQLDVECPTWESDDFDWSAPGIVLETRRSRDGGVTWVDSGSHIANVGSVEWQLLDYAAPSGPVQYQVRARSTFPGGGYVYSPWASTGTVWLDDVGSWLVSITHPDTSVRLRLFEQQFPPRSTGRTAHQVVGSTFQVVTGVGGAWQAGSAAASTYTIEEHDQLLALLDSGDLLLMRGCAERSLEDGSIGEPQDEWVRVVDVIDRSRGYDGPTQWRKVKFTYVPQADPAQVV